MTCHPGSRHFASGGGCLAQKGNWSECEKNLGPLGRTRWGVGGNSALKKDERGSRRVQEWGRKWQRKKGEEKSSSGNIRGDRKKRRWKEKGEKAGLQGQWWAEQRRGMRAVGPSNSAASTPSGVGGTHVPSPLVRGYGLEGVFPV